MKTQYKAIPALFNRCYYVLIACTLFVSCTPVFYAPNTSNVPLFQKKGEGMINAGFSGGEIVGGGEIQGAIAANDHLGIMVNTAFFSGNESEESTEEGSGKGYLVEGGAGYFTTLDKNVVFEAYGGVGFGSVTNNHYYGGTSKVGLTKLFVPPALGYTVTNVDIGVASKISAVFFNVNSIEGLDEYDMEEINLLKENPTYFFWEPSIFIRFGFEAIKAQLAYTPSLKLSSKELSQDTYMINIGLSLAFHTKQQSAQSK